MKKKLVWLLTLVVAVVAMFSLVACGGSIEGTYKFYSMKAEENGISLELKAGESYMGVTLSKDFVTMEINDDGTFRLVFAGEEETGTWTINEEDPGKIDMVVDGETATFECNGRELRMEMDGMKLTLRK